MAHDETLSAIGTEAPFSAMLWLGRLSPIARGSHPPHSMALNLSIETRGLSPS
jgi:hypothetical protein